MKRTTIGVLALTMAATTACRDMGLDGNVPLDQAENKAPRPLVEAVTQRGQDTGPRLVVDGRLWVPSGEPQDLDNDDLRAVGSGDGHTVYARPWDRPPFDAIFVQIQPDLEGFGDPRQWQQLEPVRGRTGPLPSPGDPAASPPEQPGDVGGH